MSTSGKLMEALRLTRAGRLGEATSLLRGEASAEPSPGQGARQGTTPPLPAGGWPRAAWSGETLAGRAGTTAPRTVGESPTAGGFTSHVVRCAQGERRFKLYLPTSYRGAALPLVVMLHGCTQSADDFAAGTGMNAVAEEERFIVAYPEQERTANVSRCWNWFRAGDQRRDAGEPAIIAAMVEEVAGMVRVDRARVFAAGLSAGGAAAAVLGQSYPDVFAAIGVHSGLACGAAHDLPSALQAMKGGGVAATPPRPAGRRVRTIVFHGGADQTVVPVNAQAVLRQAVDGLPPPRIERGRSPGGVAFERAVYRDGRKVVAEAWALEGVGHAWSGGSPAGSYTDPRGPDASRLMARFFLGRG